MDQYYYVDANNQRQGPVFPTDFARLGVTGETLVWRNGMENWAKASTLPELATWIAAPEPPQPPQPEPPQQPGPTGAGTYGQPAGGVYGQPTGGDRQPYQPGGVPEVMPDTYLVWAILCTVLCCLPFGIVSIVNATKVEKLWLMGNKEGARKASEDAKKWAIIGAVSSVVVGIIYGIITFIVAVAG